MKQELSGGISLTVIQTMIFMASSRKPRFISFGVLDNYISYDPLIFSVSLLES